MEIGAHLARLELTASDPAALAGFYARTFGFAVSQQGDAHVCRAPERELVLRPGEGGQLHLACFRFDSAAALHAHSAQVQARGVALQEVGESAHTVLDPEGRRIRFEHGPAAPAASTADGLPSARLQHFAVRTPDPAALLAFYTGQLGFVLSDRVRDEAGAITAAFLRTDAEHHAMAIFRAPLARFDHFSCEAQDWAALRDWADHMADAGFPLAWGVGRHGPGNDTFFMLKDMDGNMAEISAELEVCEPGRAVGEWPHQPSTLNRWGVAIMRS
jgi:predicted enzyme related to lactoylglutathione lyase/catechol 2,3-dioxygenase-like lactoylglutathione lyase family enzyme